MCKLVSDWAAGWVTIILKQPSQRIVVSDSTGDARNHASIIMLVL